MKYIAMQALTTTRFPMTTAVSLGSAFAKDSPLGPVDRLVLNVLDRTDRRWKASMLATQTIAEKVGRSVRTVQLALKRLREAGYIAVELKRKTETGKPLHSGHRIHLLWRGMWTPEPEAGDPDFGATDCAGRTQYVAPSEPAPSSMGIPEGDNPKEIDDRPAPRAESSSRSVSIDHQEGKPTDTEAAPIVAKAVEVLGPEVATPGRIGQALKEHGPAELAVAVEICEARREKDPTPLGWGFIRRILDNRKAEGRPPWHRPPEPASRHVLTVNF